MIMKKFFTRTLGMVAVNAVLASSLWAAKIPPLIKNVTVDTDVNQLEIVGSGLLSANGTAPAVWLSDNPNIPLTCQVNAVTPGAKLLCTFPVGLNASDYVLSVSDGKDTATYDLSFVEPGIAGPQGPQGAQGPIGPQGLLGPVGPAGAQGLPGALGAPGSAGAVGPQGPAGAQGELGPAGLQGPQGPQGETGDRGLAAVGRCSVSVNVVNNACQLTFTCTDGTTQSLTIPDCGNALAQQ
jgi:hypothetical protein